MVEATPTGFLFFDEKNLVFADFFQSQLVGGSPEVSAKPVDVVGVGVDGRVREVADLALPMHVFSHATDVWVHAFAVGSHCLDPLS